MTVTQHGNLTALTVYQDESGSAVLTQPLLSSVEGTVPGFLDLSTLVLTGADLQLALPGGTLTVTLVTPGAISSALTKQIVLATGLSAADLGASIAGAPFQIAVTKEAPVNPMHPDFSGGAKFDNLTDDTVAINSAVAYAQTAAQGAEIILPGLAKITARIALSANGVAIRGGSNLNCGLMQYTDNEPVIEWNTTAGIADNVLEDLYLTYFNQQVASSTNAAFVRFLTTNGTSGVFCNTFRNLRMEQGTFGIRWKEVTPATGCSFWNNTLDTIHMTNMAGSLLSNGSTTEVGSPTNWCARLTHIGNRPGPTTLPALDLGQGVEWVFTSLDIEDWTDQLINATSNSHIRIDGFHIERHTVATNNVNIINVSGDSILDMSNVEGIYVLNHSATAFLVHSVSGTVGSRGYIGKIVSAKDPSSTGAGTLQLFNLDFPPTSFMLGPRLSTSASIVDSATPSFLRAVISDQGAPPIYDSGTALPGASANYRGRQLTVKGTNASTPDVLVQCVQTASGNYAWTPVGRLQSRSTPTYSASITPDASAGQWQTITVSNTTAFTINAPTNPPDSGHSEKLAIEISNGSGGTMGVITWNAAFVFAGQTWVNPATGKKRFAQFEWNGTAWVCTAVATADY
jgi:hypothetical protein